MAVGDLAFYYYSISMTCIASSDERYIYHNIPYPFLKTHLMHIIEFDISYKDRRKYNTLFEDVINWRLFQIISFWFLGKL